MLYRDSVEHSSTESGLTVNGYDHPRKHNEARQHGSYSPNLYYGQSDGAVNSSSPADSFLHADPSTRKVKKFRKFHLLHAFVPSVIFVAFAMAGTAVFIMESESEAFEQLRNSPEMLCLRYQYYQPLKEFVLEKLGRSGSRSSYLWKIHLTNYGPSYSSCIGYFNSVLKAIL